MTGNGGETKRFPRGSEACRGLDLGQSVGWRKDQNKDGETEFCGKRAEPALG
jgi:hypothetical protein